MPSHRSYLAAVFTNCCPRCRKGKIFITNNAYAKESTKMPELCPVCGQRTEIEVGFYYGTGYVSYALSVALLVTSFVAWKILIGVSFSIDDNRIFYWMGFTFCLLFVLQPVLMRLSRSLWLSWFVTYEPNWQTHSVSQSEKSDKEQSNNS